MQAETLDKRRKPSPLVGEFQENVQVFEIEVGLEKMALTNGKAVFAKRPHDLGVISRITNKVVDVQRPSLEHALEQFAIRQFLQFCEAGLRSADERPVTTL